METTETEKTEKTKKRAHIGRYGWLLIIFGACVMMMGGPLWDAIAMNALSGGLAANIGVAEAAILSGVTIAAIIQVFIVLGYGFLMTRIGTRFLMGALMVLSGIMVILLGHISNYVVFIIVWAINLSCASFVGMGCLGELFGKFFPTKKGFVLGWATCGAAFSTILCVPILNQGIARVSMPFALLIIGLITLGLGVICFFIPHSPEKIGKLPDNGDSDPIALEMIEKSKESHEPVWTRAEAFKNKNFWLISIGYGLLYLVTPGVVMQLIPYEISMGMAPTMAMGLLMIFAAIGFAGSFVTGIMDQRIGVRLTGIIVCLVFGIACLCGGAFPFNWLTNILFVGLLGFFNGGINNIPMSHAVSVYGSESFSRMWTFIFPIIRVISACAGVTLALFMNATGSTRGAYTLFGILAFVGAVLVFFTNERLEKEPGKAPVVVK
ncbi:MAG: MFS transporter [Lachnospiraceae bacterium]|nr:MFS transporter [Lachnospiraceae bacterium]